MRFLSWIQVVGLIGLSVLLVPLLERQDLGAWFQSPLSPVWPAGRLPTAIPDSSQFGPLVLPFSSAMEDRADPFAASLWASPFSWVVVGLVFFGGLAFGIIRVLRHMQRSES